MIPGRGRTAGNGRKAQESAGKWKQYSSWKLPDCFPVDSDQFPDVKHRKLTGKHRKLTGKHRKLTGIHRKKIR